MPALRCQFPSLATFCTLSPMPNFVTWLGKLAKVLAILCWLRLTVVAVCQEEVALLPEVHARALESLADARTSGPSSPRQTHMQWLYATLSVPEPGWTVDPELRDGLRGPVSFAIFSRM